MRKGSVLGFSSAALLISAALSAVLLAGLVRIFCQACRADVLGRQRSQEAYTLLRLSQVLEEVGHNIDSHRLTILPIIHPPGTIRYRDGFEHAVAHGALTLRPQRQSQALTSLRLAPRYLLDITRCEEHGNEGTVYACQRFGPAPTSELTRGYVAVSLDGPFEVSAISHSTGRCLQLQIAQTRSMSIDPPGQAALCSARMLIPIRAHTTIYVDQRGQLRYLAHSGQDTLENQPMGGSLLSLTFRLTSSPEGSLPGVEALATFPSKRQSQLTGTVHLARQLHYNLLFNLDRL